MPLPSSGAISMSQVNTELGLSATATISLNDTAVRSLFNKAGSGTTISLSDGYGKANAFTATITTNQQEMNLRTWALANGWNGSTSATITISSGVYIWSNNRTVAGLTINGSWPGGVTVINNGFIIGRGGDGDTFAGSSTRTPGTAGGPALSLGVNVTIQNNSYIAGGGGGGGGGAAASAGGGSGFGGGGGAGGGTGGSTNHQSVRGSGTVIGGAGGAVGQSGSNSGPVQFQCSAGSGGGRILPGNGGVGATNASLSAGGGSGGGGGIGPAVATNGAAVGFGAAGGGGGWGASGGQARAGSTSAGSGGSANNAGGNAGPGTTVLNSGQAGGNAVALNGFTVTWTATGTRYGAVS